MKKTFIPLMIIALFTLSACSDKKSDTIPAEVPAKAPAVEAPVVEAPTIAPIETTKAVPAPHDDEGTEAHGHDEEPEHDDTGQPPHRH